jgi:hypothetical protein
MMTDTNLEHEKYLKKLYENLFLKNGINATPHEDE